MEMICREKCTLKDKCNKRMIRNRSTEPVIVHGDCGVPFRLEKKNE